MILFAFVSSSVIPAIRSIIPNYIEYKEQVQQPIQCWYCNCPISEHIVGCCSHIAAALWCLFLHQGNISTFNQQSNRYFDFVQDALTISDYDDSTEEDDNTYSL